MQFEDRIVRRLGKVDCQAARERQNIGTQVGVGASVDVHELVAWGMAGCAGGRLHLAEREGIDGAVGDQESVPGAAQGAEGGPNCLEVVPIVQGPCDIGVVGGPRRHPAAEAPVQ